MARVSQDDREDLDMSAMAARPKHDAVEILVQQDESAQFSQATKLCQRLVPGWQSFSANDIEVSRIDTCNALYAA